MKRHDTLDFYRSYYNCRPNQAWWAVKLTDGICVVHFHADYVTSTDWTCGEDDLFHKIEEELKSWKLAVDARWAAKRPT